MSERELPLEETKTKKPSSKGLFVDIIVCVLVPSLILKKLSGDDMLGANWALVAALSLPLTVGIWGFIRDKKITISLSPIYQLHLIRG